MVLSLRHHGSGHRAEGVRLGADIRRCHVGLRRHWRDLRRAGRRLARLGKNLVSILLSRHAFLPGAGCRPFAATDRRYDRRDPASARCGLGQLFSHPVRAALCNRAARDARSSDRHSCVLYRLIDVRALSRGLVVREAGLRRGHAGYGGRRPPIGLPAALPVLRDRCDHFTTQATLTPKVAATDRQD
jgi:hypothetical protein